MSDLIIGIDLGTTNSLVAYADEQGPRIIEGPAGQRLLPSVVHLNPKTKTPTVGRHARQNAVAKPTETIHSIKRLMGKNLQDLTDDLPHLPYQIIPHPTSPPSSPAIQIGPHTFSPPEISALILAELKQWAENHFKKTVTKAVITVPAYFDDAQRQATRDAGQLAGLQVLRIVNEPTAAALAYGLDRAEDATIAVYDFGGGTFDISILRIEKGVFRVLATNGDTHLGGDDFDRLLIQLFQSEIRSLFGPALHFNPSTLQALRTFAESVKIQLSEKTQASLEIDLGQKRLYRRTLTRYDFLTLIDPLIERSLDRCALALKDAKLPSNKIDRLVMVGGSTYMPHIRQRVADFFKTDAYTALNPMEVVALGAAVQASIIAGSRRDVLLLDVTPLSLGIETMGGAVAKLIPRGSHIPCQAHDLFSTFADGQSSVKIHVLQGERDLVKDCRSLSQFILTNLPPMPAGIPKIRVTFLIDANGILSVQALEERSATQAAIQILPSYGLTRKQVDHMVAEWLLNAYSDKVQHQLIDLRNQVALDTSAIQKAIQKVGPALDPAYKQELEEIIEGLQDMAAWTDPEAIYRALRYLDKKSAPLAEQAITQALKQATNDQ